MTKSGTQGPNGRAKYSNFVFDHFFSRIEPFWVILSKKKFFEKIAEKWLSLEASNHCKGSVIQKSQKKVPDFGFSPTFRRFSKMKTWSIFSTLADWICLILPIMKVLITLNHLTYISYLAGWHKYAKCGPLCVKRFKILICDFGYTGDFPMNIVIC